MLPLLLTIYRVNSFPGKYDFRKTSFSINAPEKNVPGRNVRKMRKKYIGKYVTGKYVLIIGERVLHFVLRFWVTIVNATALLMA